MRSRFLWILVAGMTPMMAFAADLAIVAKEMVKVEKGRIISSVTIKGNVEGDNKSELKVTLKTWTNPLVVESAAAHGTVVKKGDLLLKFGTEKIEQQLRSQREDRESALLAIRIAEHELPLARQLLPLDLIASERLKKQTAEDLDYFLQVEKAHEVENWKMMLRSAEFQWEYSKEELHQLEKMYRDKDLTEETEQMILKRYKFSLEAAEIHLRATRSQVEHGLKVMVPRREEDAKLSAARAEINWAKAREELPMTLRQKELGLEKQRRDEQRAQERLAELEQDWKAMTVTAPSDGVLYHGRYAYGQWTGPQPTSYLKGGTLPANEGVLTIIAPGKAFLYGEVEEKEAADLKVGQPARISPTISPNQKLEGKVHRVAAVPQNGKYAVVIAITDNNADSMIPGMSGTVRIIKRQNDAALTLPSSTVFEDPEDDSHFVYVPGDKPDKKSVKIGIISGGRTEILEGLKEGDQVLASKP